MPIRDFLSRQQNLKRGYVEFNSEALGEDELTVRKRAHKRPVVHGRVRKVGGAKAGGKRKRTRVVCPACGHHIHCATSEKDSNNKELDVKNQKVPIKTVEEPAVPKFPLVKQNSDTEIFKKTTKTSAETPSTTRITFDVEREELTLPTTPPKRPPPIKFCNNPFAMIAVLLILGHIYCMFKSYPPQRKPWSCRVEPSSSAFQCYFDFWPFSKSEELKAWLASPTIFHVILPGVKLGMAVFVFMLLIRTVLRCYRLESDKYQLTEQEADFYGSCSFLAFMFYFIISYTELCLTYSTWTLDPLRETQCFCEKLFINATTFEPGSIGAHCLDFNATYIPTDDTPCFKPAMACACPLKDLEL